MARWLVKLEGDPFDLEELPYWFPSGDVHAIKDDNDVFLTGQTFEKYNNAREVHDAALQTIDEFSAIIMLLWSDFRRPSLNVVIREDDKGKHDICISAQLAPLRGKVRARVQISGQESSSETQAQQLLVASRGNHHLRTAVSLWGDPLRTWPRLYRMLEEIEAAIGEKVDKAGFCAEVERNLFTRCANTAEVAGKDARHRSGKFSPPANPMSLEEAIALISRLLEQALRHQL
jgi:hypothetical protein